MSNSLRFLNLFFSAVFLLSLATGIAGADPYADLSRTLVQSGFNKQHTSIAVIDIDSGAMLASHQPDLALNPASCMKILTAAAALSSLGPDYRFHTDFLADRKPKDGTVDTLYISGSGDPLLVNEEIWLIARKLYDAGLRRVRGDIAIDDSFFDSQGVPRKGGNNHRAYAANTSAAAVNFNAVSVHMRPGQKADAPAIVDIEPPVDYFRVVNNLKTGGKYGVRIVSELAGDHETVSISGTLPQNSEPQTILRSIADPVQYAGGVFKYILGQNGIAVEGKIKKTHVPAGAVSILSAESQPLSLIVERMNKFSNNFIAEQLTKHLGAVRFGRPGSTEKGMRAVRDYLESIGIPQNGYTIENGSGLSDMTRISAKNLAEILAAIHRDFTIRPEFLASLPIVGVDGTTKGWKFASQIRGLARAKTGTLSGVSTLAGYVPLKNGRIAAFSILANGLKDGADAVHRAQINVVKAISEVPQ